MDWLEVEDENRKRNVVREREAAARLSEEVLTRLVEQMQTPESAASHDEITATLQLMVARSSSHG